MAANRWMRRSAVAVWIFTLIAPASAPRAGVLATYDDGRREIVLMTQHCPGSAAQQARAGSGPGALEGCWSVNARGNPVVRWRDGRRQELQEARVKLTPEVAALLDDPSTPGGTFARPEWCAHATFRHEREVCADRQLAAADLALAPLWRSFRERVSARERRRVQADYFRRLKACGGDKGCIAREQSAQQRYYRRFIGLP